MPDADESLRQHMQKETAQELGCVQRHFALLAAMSIVLPAEGDALAIERQQAMIRDSDPMRIPAQIAENLGGRPERWLGVYNPPLPEE